MEIARPVGCQLLTSCPALLVGCKLSRPGESQEPPRVLPDRPPARMGQHPGASRAPARNINPTLVPVLGTPHRPPVGGVLPVEAWRMPGRDRPSRGGCCLMETARLDGGSILEPHNRPPVGIVQIGHPKNARARAPARNINPTLVPVLGTPQPPRPFGGCCLSRPGGCQEPPALDGRQHPGECQGARERPPAWWCCSLDPGGWKSRGPVASWGQLSPLVV